MGCNRLGTAEDKEVVQKELAVAEAKCHAPDCSGAEVQAAFELGGMPAVLALQASKETIRQNALFNQQADHALRERFAIENARLQNEQAAREAERLSSNPIFNHQADHALRERFATENARLQNEQAVRESERQDSNLLAIQQTHPGTQDLSDRYLKDKDTKDKIETSLSKNTYDPMMRNADEKTWYQLADQARGMRTPDGVVHIQSIVGDATERGGFERLLLPGVKVGLEGYQRAHSHGPGTGQEVATGILYAPSIVNQELQNHGLEKHIRDVRERVDGIYQVLLKTETEALTGTLRLRRITYRLELHELDVDPFNATPLMAQEAEIRIDGTSQMPHISFDPWEAV